MEVHIIQDIIQDTMHRQDCTIEVRWGTQGPTTMEQLTGTAMQEIHIIHMVITETWVQGCIREEQAV